MFWFQGTKVASASSKSKIKKQRGSINNNSIKDDINSEENKLGTSYLRGNYTLLTHTEILKGTENNYINDTAEASFVRILLTSFENIEDTFFEFECALCLSLLIKNSTQVELIIIYFDEFASELIAIGYTRALNVAVLV